MELVILLVIVVGVIGYFIWKDQRHEESGNHPLEGATKNAMLDVNKDGQVDIKDAAFLDVNKDGKVDIKDAVAAVEVVTEEVKTVAKKATSKAKKAAVEVEAKVEAAVKKARAPRKPKK